MMFYLAADNDLYSQAADDIAELQKIAGIESVDILVQLDSPSGAFRYKVLPQGNSILASLGQSNSGSPEALADFGVWAVKAYPARKYLLVLWDHGTGWSKSPKFIGYDQQFNDFLSVAGGELRDAVGKIRSAAGQALDIVVFDACSMQMAEVLTELDGLCRYAVGSEALFPVEGMPYVAAWKGISGNTPPETLAISLVKSCGVYDSLGYQVTCSAVDICSLSAAAKGLMSLTGTLRQLPVSSYISAAAIQDSVLCFPPFASYDLCRTLDRIGGSIPDPENKMVLNASQKFRDCILAQSVSGSQYQSAQGLAVWFPTGRTNFQSQIESYHNLAWSGVSGWDKILYQLLCQNDSYAAAPQNIRVDANAQGIRQLKWESGYDPSGIDHYEIRHCQGLIIDFNDQGRNSDSANWDKTGFTIAPKADGDTSYYSIGGQMTIKTPILFDATGNIGFFAEGIWGIVILEYCSDPFTGWETLGTWDMFGVSRQYYCSAKVESESALIRFSWEPFSWGSWVYLDDIKVCHPDSEKAMEATDVSEDFYTLSNHPGAIGFYQIRSVDSLQNISAWSKDVYYQPPVDVFHAWPNPFKKKIYLSVSSLNETIREVKVFNILGQFVDRMKLQKGMLSGGISENLYCWEPEPKIVEGVYIAQLSSNKGSRAVKMILIR